MRVSWLAVMTAGCVFRPATTEQDTQRDAAMHARDAPDAAGDTSPDAYVACTAISVGASAIVAPSVSTPPTIDGHLDDWATCFVEVDLANAQLVRHINGAMEPSYPSGKFALEHDAQTLFVAAEVVGVPPLGSAALPNIYENDSVGFYIDPDGLAGSAVYTVDMQQIVVDHLNQLQEYRNGGEDNQLGSGATSAVVTEADGVTYTMELAVPASALGVTQFATPFGFDIGWTDGNGTTQLSEVTLSP